MKTHFWFIGLFAFVLALLAACGGSDNKELANGYTEEQNATDTTYIKLLSTWDPLYRVDSTKHKFENDDGESLYWYEVNFNTEEKIYFTQKDSEANGECTVDVYEGENGIRLTLNSEIKQNLITQTLSKDSLKALIIDRIDNEYGGDNIVENCQADSTQFVNDCKNKDGTFEDLLGLKTCSVLHLTCTKTFKPDLSAQEYLQILAKDLQKQCETELEALKAKDTTETEEKLDSTFTDARDGKVYRQVKIGDQVWMAENLNYAYLEKTSLWDSSSFCYNNDPRNCEKFGRLYIWSAALDSAGIFNDDAKGCGLGVCLPRRKVQGICPDGWRIPTYDEWETLILGVGTQGTAGGLLKSKEYDGSDRYKFSVLLSGNHTEYATDEYANRQIDEQTQFITATEVDSSSYVQFMFTYMGDFVGMQVSSSKYIAHPLRCIKGDNVSEIYAGALDPKTVQKSYFTDSRDNRKYKTVTIGSQTWMAENLAYDNGNESNCYDDDETNCNKYGRLYSWYAAVGSTEDKCDYANTCGLTAPIQGVCPSGWHLPQKQEIDTLTNRIGIVLTPLKASSGWGTKYGNGTDLYGFDLLPAGYETWNTKTESREPADLGVESYLWTTQISTTSASETSVGYSTYFVSHRSGTGGFAQQARDPRSRMSVRCIKD